MTPEGRVKDALKKRLDQLGAYHFWPVQMGYGAPMVDCIGCYNGKCFAIETKAPKKKITLRQQAVLDRMQVAGAMTFVINSVETANAFTFPAANTDIQT